MRYQKLPDWRKTPFLSRLGDLSNPPKNLFYKGKLDESVFTNCIAIVGSRRITDYGRRVIEKIIPKLVFDKKTIISGFMYGVDQYAHSICLENGGKTIAILGWGIEYPLTGQDKKLADQITDGGGLLLSEWDHQRPTLWTFPRRNRLVAALSTDVIVVEAAIKSGSLITAHIAKKLNRTVWAIPGPITSAVSEGTNLLISSGAARLWVGESERLHEKPNDPILATLTDEPLSASELARKLGAPVSEIGAQLSLLTLNGAIREQDEKYFIAYARKN